MKPFLVLMAKRPVAGAVKTRLAAEVGTAEALRFYRANLAATIRRLGHDPRWHFAVAAAPDGAVGDPAFGGAMALPQGGGDLGARMQRIMDRMPPGPVVIVGADIPGIRPGHVAAAFRALGAADAVFGPAGDGGYWLVGLRRRPHVPRAFDGVRWSGPHALADTVRNLTEYRMAFVDALDDVDEATDLRRWQRARMSDFETE